MSTAQKTVLHDLSIRSQLMLMVLCVALPAAGLVGWYVYHDSQEAQKAAYAKVKILAEDNATALGYIVHDNQEVLGRLAQRPLVRALDRKHCDPILDLYIKARPESGTLAVRDVHADIVCTRLSNPPPAQYVRESSWFKKVSSAGQFTIGDITRRKYPPGWVFISAFPIHDSRQNVSGFVFFSTDLLRLNEHLFQSGTKNAVVEVVDRNGQFLLRSIDHEQWIGKPSPYPVADTFRGQREGYFVRSGADNVKRLYAFATVPGTDWRVLAGLPEEEIFAEPGKRLSRGIAIGLATLILVLFLTWQVSATIVNPLRDLVAVTGKLAAGDATARVADLRGSREIGILGEAFNAMASTLHDRETVLKEAQRLAGVGSWEWIIDADIVTGSEEFCRLHNCATKLPSLHFEDLAKQYDQESRGRLNAAIEGASQRGTSYDLDLKTTDGRYITARGEAVRDASGRIARVRGTWQDITERKHAEDVRTNLAAIVDNSNDAIVSRDRDNNIFSWNRAAERMFGYTLEEVIGKNISLLVPPEREGEINLNRGLHTHGRVVMDLETVRLTKDGRRIEVSVTASPIYDEQGVLVSVGLIFRDISERVRKTALIQLLESLARATNEATTPEVAMRSCLEQICAYGKWSLGHVALYAPGQTTSIAPTSFWHCGDMARFGEFIRYSDSFSRNALSGQFVGVMMRERRSVWIDDIASSRNVGRLKSADKFGIRAGFVFPIVVRGEISGYLEFFATEVRAPDEMLLDAMSTVASQLARLIERGRAADELAKLNSELEMRVADRTSELEIANKELNSFSYTIAHDMRAPVRAINGFSEIVLKTNEGKLDQTSVGYLNRVVAGSKRMGELIDDLLNLARLSRQEIRRRVFNLSELAAAVITSLREAHPERNVAVTIQPDMNANGDPGLMRAALENLIGNAWKFTAKTSAARIEIGTEQRDGWTVFCVCDNGAGFDMQYAHKLFAPFQRLHHASDFEGTGIGLATVRKIVDRHGGKIWIDSAVNLGTTVYFTIGKSA